MIDERIELIPKDATAKHRMARKLRTKTGKAVYALRKVIPEPVFGQMKPPDAGQLLLRGHDAARAERTLHATVHNLRKLAAHRDKFPPVIRIPKLRQGRIFPSLLEPLRRVDRALWAVIMTACATGTSTRKVDELVKALGCETGLSKSTVSQLCAVIDEQVAALRERRLDQLRFPYVYLDATYIKARVNHQVVSRAVVIATGDTSDGNLEVLGVDVGDSEDELSWTGFLRSLKDPGLAGVQLVISDAHTGLKAAIARVIQGAAWQRCRVHLMRNLLACVPKGPGEMVAALVRTIFAQTDVKATRTQLGEIVGHVEGRFDKAAGLLSDAEHDVTAYARLPRAHWRKIWSTNPLESSRRSSGGPTSSGCSPTTPR